MCGQVTESRWFELNLVESIVREGGETTQRQLGLTVVTDHDPVGHYSTAEPMTFIE